MRAGRCSRCDWRGGARARYLCAHARASTCPGVLGASRAQKNKRCIPLSFFASQSSVARAFRVSTPARRPNAYYTVCLDVQGTPLGPAARYQCSILHDLVWLVFLYLFNVRINCSISFSNYFINDTTIHTC